jgi:tetratricopeptide (TPR) repeat protein
MKTGFFVTWLAIVSCGSTVAVGAIPDSLKVRIDSLKSLINHADIEKRYVGEFGIAYELFDVDNPVAVKHARNAHKLSSVLGDTTKMIVSGRIFAQLLRRLDRTDSAINLLQQILPWAEARTDLVETGRILNALAIACNNRGRYDLAVLYNLKALRVRRHQQDSNRIATTLGNAGLAYLGMDNFVESDHCFREASLYAKDSLQKSWLAVTHAYARLPLGDTTSFKPLLRQGVAYAKGHLTPEVLVTYHHSFGEFYRITRKFDSALSSYRKSLEVSISLLDTRRAAGNLLGIAQSHYEANQLDSAYGALQKAESFLSQDRYDGIRLWFLELMSNVLKGKRQFKRSLEFRIQYEVLQDTILSMRIANNVAVARLEFEEEQNEALISQQNEIIALKEIVINRQLNFLTVSTILGIALLALAVVLFRFSQYQRRVSRDLDKKVSERTHDLKSMEIELVRRLGEQKILLDLISSRMRSSVATISGLWSIAMSGSFDKSTVNRGFEKAACDLLQVPKVIERSTGPRTCDSLLEAQGQPANQLSLSLGSS